MSKYVSIYRNDFGSHWQKDHDSVTDFRRWLLKDPEIEWAYLIYATTGRIVEHYEKPGKKARKT